MSGSTVRLCATCKHAQKPMLRFCGECGVRKCRHLFGKNGSTNVNGAKLIVCTECKEKKQ